MARSKEDPEGSFSCSLCGKRWATVLYKINCEKSHSVFYVPIKREDIGKLLQFIYTHYDPDEDQILPERLMNIFTKIMKTRLGAEPDLSYDSLYGREEKE